MTYLRYKCSTCGTRRSTPELLAKHKKKGCGGFRCPECRTWRATYKAMQDHIKKHKHFPCTCGGYHYKHRRGSPYCEHNPRAAFLHAARAEDLNDEQLMELLIDIIWDSDGKTTGECPF